MKAVLIGTYPPVACGIATFTADVEVSLRAAGVTVSVVPILPEPLLAVMAGDTVPLGQRTPQRWSGPCIARNERVDYGLVAERINAAHHDVVIVEHEFGIFGGRDGEFLIDLVETLRVPVVVTLHTVLSPFSAHQGEVIRRICRCAAAVTVFTETARHMLIEQALADRAQIRVVPHGAPTEMYLDHDRVAIRRKLGLAPDALVLSTFGLLSPGKGIEVALAAFAEVVAAEPRAMYVVAGRTHPEVARLEGERYRDGLVELADRLGLSDRTVFLGRFLSVHELAELLAVTDVFCTPYIGGAQIVSGALTFALAAGCPVVSTPYRYAVDVLADGAGLLVGFGDSHAFAEAVLCLLAPGPDRARARQAARTAALDMAWPAVGIRIAALLGDVVNSRCDTSAAASARGRTQLATTDASS